MNQLWGTLLSVANKVRLITSPRYTVMFGPGVVMFAAPNPQPVPAFPYRVRFTDQIPVRAGRPAAVTPNSDLADLGSTGTRRVAETTRRTKPDKAATLLPDIRSTPPPFLARLKRPHGGSPSSNSD